MGAEGLRFFISRIDARHYAYKPRALSKHPGKRIMAGFCLGMKMKICPYCGNEFEGHPLKIFCSNSCRNKQWWHNNLEKGHASSRRWAAANQERVKALRKIYNATHKDKRQAYGREWAHNNEERYREIQNRHFKKYREIYPEKTIAHNIVATAVRYGRLTRPTICSNCGQPNGKIEAHHHNGYSEEHAMDVVWLCRKCHLKADKAIQVEK